MRIVIASRIYRPEPSAASLRLGAVADALVARGADVEVLTAKPPKGLQPEQSSERVRTFPVLRDSNGYVRGYAQYMSFDIPLFFRLLFTRRPDVVLVEPPPTTGVVVRIVCAIRRIPYVYAAADIWSDAAGHATSSGLVVRLVRSFERFALKGASALVTISQGVVDRVRALGVKTPAHITGSGADTQAFRYEDHGRVEQLFLYAGTHTELHGAAVLIEAFAQFNETTPGYRLQFIGNGTGQELMMQQANELGVADAVSFEGTIAAEQLNTRLATATASLATLLPGGGYEYAFTTKVYSSLAAGCPVIFAGPGPTKQFIEQARQQVPVGFSVDYGASAIAEAMRELANNPLSADQRLKVAEWASAGHSLAAVAENVSSVVESVAREARS